MASPALIHWAFLASQRWFVTAQSCPNFAHEHRNGGLMYLEVVGAAKMEIPA